MDEKLAKIMKKSMDGYVEIGFGEEVDILQNKFE